MSCLPLRSLPGMKHKVKITILSALGVLLVGSSVAYAYSQKGTLISQKTEELPDGNIYVEELADRGFPIQRDLLTLEETKEAILEGLKGLRGK